MQLLEENIYKFRDALDRMGSVASISSDLKFLSLSPNFTALLGYTKDDLIGKSIHFLNYEGANTLQLMQMVRHLYEGGTWIGDIICRHKNGNSVEVRVSISPSISNGVISGYVALYQKSFVQVQPFDLDDVLYKYRSAFNKIAGLAIITSAGEVQEVNDLFVDMFGYSREEWIGSHIGKLTRNDSLVEMPSQIWDVVSKGQIYSGESENYRRDGQSVFVRVTVAPASEASLNVIASFDAYLVICQDITKEAELRINQQELAVEAAKQQMLAGAIHNISNLQQGVLAANSNALLGAQSLDAACRAATEHYKSLTTPEEKNSFLDGVNAIVQGSVGQIVTAVHEERKAIDETVAVLNSFRREQKNIRQVTDESISAFVQRTLNTFSLQAARHNIAVWISSMQDAQVQWPTAQIHQIIFNLLINAQQAICEQVEGGKLAAHRGRIELAIVLEGDDVLFYVKDNGGGFNGMEHQLFTPKFTTKAAGSGIGLHTSAIMARSMGGPLSAENAEINGQRGAQFLLCVPKMVAAKGGIL